METNLAVIQEQSIGLVKQAELIKEEAAVMQVVDLPTKQVAVDFLGKIANVKKGIEAQRKVFSDPLYQRFKEINDMFARILDPVKAADKDLRNKVMVWQSEEARRQKQAEEIAMAEARARAEQDNEVIPVVEPVGNGIAKTMRAVSGTATIREVWKYRVVDADAVPKEYLMLDHQKIGKVVAAGIRNIPGIEIYPASTMSVRGKKG